MPRTRTQIRILIRIRIRIRVHHHAPCHLVYLWQCGKHSAAAAAAGNASLHEKLQQLPAATDWFQLFKKVKGVFQTFVYFFFIIIIIIRLFVPKIAKNLI